MNKIVRVFLDTNLSLQHNGLFMLAAKNKVNLTKLDLGEHVVFVNKALNKVKVYSCGGIVSYMRRDDGQRIDLGLISHIPTCFDKQLRLDWEKAAALSLDQKLKNKKSPIFKGI
jgi:hypothetical protein